MNIAAPLRMDASGRTRLSRDDAEHVREMIELLLFTHAGERPMRPDFGAGLLQYVFGPLRPDIAAMLQSTLVGALAQFLGDVIDVRSASVEADDATLRATVVYALRGSGDVRTETFVRSAT